MIRSYRRASQAHPHRAAKRPQKTYPRNSQRPEILATLSQAGIWFQVLIVRSYSLGLVLESIRANSTMIRPFRENFGVRLGMKPPTKVSLISRTEKADKSFGIPDSDVVKMYRSQHGGMGLRSWDTKYIVGGHPFS